MANFGIHEMIISQKAMIDLHRFREISAGSHISAINYSLEATHKHQLIREYLWRIMTEVKEAHEVITERPGEFTANQPNEALDDLVDELTDVSSFVINLCIILDHTPSYIPRLVFNDSYPMMMLEHCYRIERSLGSKPWRKVQGKTDVEAIKFHLDHLYSFTRTFIEDYCGADFFKAYQIKNQIVKERHGEK